MNWAIDLDCTLNTPSKPFVYITTLETFELRLYLNALLVQNPLRVASLVSSLTGKGKSHPLNPRTKKKSK
jgi:hypothetical protein